MFVFLEGDGELPEIRVDRHWHDFVVCTRPLEFEEAIRMLATRSNRSKYRPVIFSHFLKFTKHLDDWQLRGLERIALGDNAIELNTSKEKYSRFIASVCGVPPGKNDDLLQMMEIWDVNKMWSEGIGRFTAGNTLFVGDTPGKNSMGFNTPFVGSGSGRWLTELLEIAEIHEGFYYWINAKDGYGKPADTSIMDELRPSRVIAFGNEADKWVDKAIRLDVEYIKVPHPQYWKRFKSGEPYPLIDWLKHSPVAL